MDKFLFNINDIKKLNLDFTYRSFSSFNIKDVSSIKNPTDHSLLYSISYNEDVKKQITSIENAVVSLPLSSKSDIAELPKSNVYCFSERPRIVYAIILNHILKINKKMIKYKKTCFSSYIAENTIIGKNVDIEPYVFIDENVVISDNCVIKSGSKINKFTFIDNYTIIDNNVIIGSMGFDIDRADDGKTYPVPHIGGVKICNNVTIGANSIIAQGKIYPTVIHEQVRIDNSVIIGSDVEIKSGTIIAANVVISNSVVIGKNVWIGPNAVIANNRKIGVGAFIGLGNRVIKDIEKNQRVVDLD